MTLTEKGGLRSNNRKMVLKSLTEDNKNSSKSTVNVRSSSDRTRLLKLNALVHNKKFVTKK
tara:strand:- start:328 stop:510 length:183 start_codon:yes stop_codon:yes gene_type:complete